MLPLLRPKAARSGYDPYAAAFGLHKGKGQGSCKGKGKKGKGQGSYGPPVADYAKLLTAAKAEAKGKRVKVETDGLLAVTKAKPKRVKVETDGDEGGTMVCL